MPKGICPFCNDPLPTPVYDESTHTYDMNKMMEHLNGCGSKTVDEGREGTWE